MVPIKQHIANPGNFGGKRTKPIEWIVMHYTSNDWDSDESNGNYFANNVVKSSAHYFVDDDSITLSVPEDTIAWHCGTAGGAYQQIHPYCTNGNSIGIEMCDGVKDGVVKASEKTLQNAAELAAMLCKKYSITVDHIIRHYDVTHKLCPAYWINNDGLEQFRKRVSDILTPPAPEPEKPSDWATEAAQWAIDNEIVNGDGHGNYSWRQPITREQFVTILYRFSKLL